MIKKKTAYVQLVLGMVCTGSHVVAGKAVTGTFPVLFASGITLAVSSILFLLYFILFEKRIPRTDGRSFLLILVQSFTGIFIFRIGILKGLSYTGAIEGGIILSSTPVLIGLLSFILLKERLSLRKIAALIIAMAGVITLNLIQPDNSENGNILLGSLFLSAAVVGEALFTVLRGIIGKKVNPLVNAAYATFIGAVLFLPFMIAQMPSIPVRTIPFQQWLILFYYGTAAPIGAFILWFSGVSRTSGSTAAVFTTILPVVTLILSVILLGETFLPIHLIGALCIIAGILISLERIGEIKTEN